ncbi:MAG: hypothetical protein R2752_14450 [Vicinamibacterales bacterium]
MTKRWIGTAAAVLGALGLTATAASAQMIRPWTGKGYFNVNGGAQTKARSQTVSDSFPLYDETASWDGTIGVGSSSIVDVSGGVRVWRNVAVGLGYSHYSKGTSAVINASVPDPLFFDQPHGSSVTVPGLEHKERDINLSVVYVMPISDLIDVSVFGGPAFFGLTKSVVTDVTIPAGGTAATGATTTTVKRNGTGGHFGVDVRANLLRGLGGQLDLGVGIFLRYAGASVDFPEVNEGKVDVGGFQYGGGLRVRF